MKYMAHALALTLSLLASLCHAEQYAVIVHPDNPARMKAETAALEIRELYLGWKPRWDHNTLVQALARPEDSEAQQTFREQVLGMSAQEEKKHWKRALIIHDKRAPRNISQERLVLALVAQSPGGLGVVRLTTAHANPQRVKVLLTLDKQQ